VKTSTANVTTSAGIEVVLTLRVHVTSVIITATAIESLATTTHDRLQAARELEYRQRAAELGIAAAGDPPLSASHIFLSEINIIPPQELRGIGKLVKYVGGSGSEWTTVWEWVINDDYVVNGVFMVDVIGARAELSAR